MMTVGAAIPLRQDAPRRGFGSVVAMVAARWRNAAMLRRARQQVAEMDDHMLADIGVSRAQALFEIDRTGH